MRTALFDEHVRYDAADEGADGSADERYPRHPVRYLSLRLLLHGLEEELRIQGPHVAAAVSYAAGNAEKKDGRREEEGFEEFDHALSKW